MEWYDFIRGATAIVSLAAMYYLGRNWVRRSTVYSVRLRDFWWAMNAMLVVVVTTSIEKIVADVGLTWSLAFSFFASLICLKAAFSKNTIMLLIDDPKLILTNKS